MFVLVIRKVIMLPCHYCCMHKHKILLFQSSSNEYREFSTFGQPETDLRWLHAQSLKILKKIINQSTASADMRGGKQSKGPKYFLLLIYFQWRGPTSIDCLFKKKSIQERRLYIVQYEIFCTNL